MSADPTPERTIQVIEAAEDEGFAQLDLADGQTPPAEGLAILSLPCPGARINRGGVGGATMTTCQWCGELMPSTAGPHSADGRYPKPVVVTSVGDGLVFWRAFSLRLAAPGEGTGDG